jgi:beta-lactamase class A
MSQMRALLFHAPFKAGLLRVAEKRGIRQGTRSGEPAAMPCMPWARASRQLSSPHEFVIARRDHEKRLATSLPRRSLAARMPTIRVRATSWVLVIASLSVIGPPGAHSAGARVTNIAERSVTMSPKLKSARSALEAEIARIAATAGGKVGVSARHLESALAVSLNGTEMYPMASTFKIAVAGALLTQVDAGRLSLEQMISVDPALVLSSEGIAEIFPYPGVSASVHNLIESMLTRSDNTATNVLTRLAGGPAAVTAWVRSIGVENMRIDGDTNGIVGRFFDLPPSEESVDAQLKKLFAANPELGNLANEPNAKFDDDPRDTATPDAMVLLLSEIQDAHLLSAASTDVLLGAMERCITGLKRLRGMLPPGTLVRHKTGTIGGTVNDVGIITLPDGRGRIAIAVFIKKSAKPIEARERAIAEIARSVYDYMLIESVGSR